MAMRQAAAQRRHVGFVDYAEPEGGASLADWDVVIDLGSVLRTGTPDKIRLESTIATPTGATRQELSFSTVHSMGSALNAAVLHQDRARFSLAGQFTFKRPLT